jgi:catecholate siderophore receptor
LSASGKLTPEWGVTAGYSYLHGKIVSSANPLEVGQPMSSAPKNSASLWTTYVFPGHWEVGGGFTYVGERVVNTTNTRQVDGYATLDAMVAYRVNSNFTMRLNAYNLANKSYVLDMYNTGSSGHVIPGSGRSAVLTGEFFF